MTKYYVKHAAHNQTKQQKMLGIWAGSMSNWENRLNTVTVHAWERWTQNGLGIDHDTQAQAQTLKTVSDAANDAWIDGMTNSEWLAATLQRLEG